MCIYKCRKECGRKLKREKEKKERLDLLDEYP